MSERQEGTLRPEFEAFRRSRAYRILQEAIETKKAEAIQGILRDDRDYPSVCFHRGWHEGLVDLQNTLDAFEEQAELVEEELRQEERTGNEPVE